MRDWLRSQRAVAAAQLHAAVRFDEPEAMLLLAAAGSGYEGDEAPREDPSGETSGFHPSWGNYGEEAGGVGSMAGHHRGAASAAGATLRCVQPVGVTVQRIHRVASTSHAAAAAPPTPPPTHPPLSIPSHTHRAGNDSGGECGVQLSRRFQMPDVSDLGYWSRNLTADMAEALAAAAASDSDGSGASNARRRNPTLGPAAAAFLARAAAAAEAAQTAQLLSLQAGPSAGAAAAAAAAGSAPGAAASAPNALPNPPFWYSFSHGSVHFVVISTEHDLSPGSRQYRVSILLHAGVGGGAGRGGVLGPAGLGIGPLLLLSAAAWV